MIDSDAAGLECIKLGVQIGLGLLAFYAGLLAIARNDQRERDKRAREELSRIAVEFLTLSDKQVVSWRGMLERFPREGQLERSAMIARASDLNQSANLEIRSILTRLWLLNENGLRDSISAFWDSYQKEAKKLGDAIASQVTRGEVTYPDFDRKTVLGSSTHLMEAFQRRARILDNPERSFLSLIRMGR